MLILVLEMDCLAGTAHNKIHFQDKGEMSEIRMAPGPAEKVFDLVDVVEEEDLMDRPGHLLGRTVYDLVDVVEGTMPAVPPAVVSEEEIRKQVAAISESIARELFPAIAERIIREEIAKLRGEQKPEAEN